MLDFLESTQLMAVGDREALLLSADRTKNPFKCLMLQSFDEF
jgi:hypothetical protein